MGELGTARRFAEVGVELRLPTPYFNQQVFVFYEHASDLGSAKDVPGNPTAHFRKPGMGATTGGGLKIGPLRAEYVKDLNVGRGCVMLCIGERF